MVKKKVTKTKTICRAEKFAEESLHSTFSLSDGASCRIDYEGELEIDAATIDRERVLELIDFLNLWFREQS